MIETVALNQASKRKKGLVGVKTVLFGPLFGGSIRTLTSQDLPQLLSGCTIFYSKLRK